MRVPKERFKREFCLPIIDYLIGNYIVYIYIYIYIYIFNNDYFR